ncbi:hypothetical protein ATY47_07425 [Xanthomonas oryzae pv. oryzae]|nr:hypothetical protein ATY47_07425 [Xanthomonas oryzae pv. oryzae]
MPPSTPTSTLHSIQAVGNDWPVKARHAASATATHSTQNATPSHGATRVRQRRSCASARCVCNRGLAKSSCDNSHS